MKNRPKVLVVSHNAFSKCFNNGKTLASFFSQFPRENLAQLYFRDEVPDFSACEHFFRITDRQAIRSLFYRGNPVGEVVVEGAGSQRISDDETSPVKVSKTPFTLLVRDAIWFLSRWRSALLIKWITEFKPDVIFYVGGDSGFSHRIAQDLAKSLSVPLAVYFTDDYVKYSSRRLVWPCVQAFLLRKRFFKTVSAASMHFAIGEKMAREYSELFNQKFFVLLNSVDCQLRNPARFSPPLRICYFGGLHLGRFEMLCRFAQLLAKSRVPSLLHVYTFAKLSEEQQVLAHQSGVCFEKGCSGKELDDAISYADVLLHVESDLDENVISTKLSVSTKIPEYLAANRLVVGYGPVSVASMALLSDNGIGCVIDSADEDLTVIQRLDSLLCDHDRAQALANRGVEYARRTFNREIIARDFLSKMTHLANHQ